MAMFGRARDVSLFRHVNRELINNIITQQVGFYKYMVEATTDNIYGETPERYFADPVLINCLITFIYLAFLLITVLGRMNLRGDYSSLENYSYYNYMSFGFFYHFKKRQVIKSFYVQV